MVSAAAGGDREQHTTDKASRLIPFCNILKECTKRYRVLLAIVVVG